MILEINYYIGFINKYKYRMFTYIKFILTYCERNFKGVSPVPLVKKISRPYVLFILRILVKLALGNFRIHYMFVLQLRYTFFCYKN